MTENNLHGDSNNLVQFSFSCTNNIYWEVSHGEWLERNDMSKFSASLFLQISSCDQGEVLQDLFVEKNASLEDSYHGKFPGKTHKGDSRAERVPWVTEENVQLEILTPTDSEAQGKRYFVPNGDRGEKWLQFYFQGCDTGGILLQNEIKEREGKGQFTPSHSVNAATTLQSR